MRKVDHVPGGRVKLLNYFSIVLLFVFLASCSQVPEVPVIPIPLPEPLAASASEISGLCWYKDYLILLPQYPDSKEWQGGGKFYAMAKADILAYLDRPDHSQAPSVKGIDVIAPGLEEKIPGFEGYEAIGFKDDWVYVCIESETMPGKLASYLIKGKIDGDMSKIVFDTSEPLTRIEGKSGLENYSEEALVITEEYVMTIHEANGANVNPMPVAHVFQHDLKPAGVIPFPVVEFRLTDATAMDTEGVFWCINFSYSGDLKKLNPAEDGIAHRYGRGKTHKNAIGTERLVAFRYTPQGVTLVERPPVQLQLKEQPRNWEGLVRLDDRGFLIITDEYPLPRTILGFVKSNQ